MATDFYRQDRGHGGVMTSCPHANKLPYGGWMRAIIHAIYSCTCTMPPAISEVAANRAARIPEIKSSSFVLLTIILIIISFPSPTRSFIPGLKPSFSANSSHRSLSFFFFRTDYIIPQTFTVTSEHIRFYFSVFFCFTLFSCRFLAVD